MRSCPRGRGLAFKAGVSLHGSMSVSLVADLQNSGRSIAPVGRRPDEPWLSPRYFRYAIA